MSLQPGTRLGPYEVSAQIGVGGMGEVYEATDTNLKRAVAIKVLPESLASDPDRLARFQREAEVLASLNHPNIAAIYGLEKSDGTTALVMELVEGEDLSQRIARGPIPIDEALPIAKQIAEALEAAHEQGIIHRDLKPANIKVTPDGVVKVLDFGLAKLAESATSTTNPSALSMSPTITSPALVSGVGVLLGTAAYMAPEQAKGRVADKRSDVWAFAAVLYEMLTGQRAFGGDDLSDTLANVLKVDPDWSRLPNEVPVLIRTLLQRCLDKDRRRRVADVAAIQFILTLDPTLASGGASSAVRPVAGRSFRRRLAVPAALLITGATTAAMVLFFTRSTPQPVTRLTMSSSGNAAAVADPNERALTMSPDGSKIAYIGANGGVPGTGFDARLFVRALDQLQPTLIAGPGATRSPFFSPDGAWVGFFEPLTRMQKVSAAGGPPIPLTTIDAAPRGATWGPDDTIIYATTNGATGLQRISANGGEPTTLTRPNREKGERDHFWPFVLPGGRAVLFTIVPAGPIENAQIAVLDLRDGSQKIVVRGGSDARYVKGGYLVYGSGGTLRAVAFDADSLEAHGTPVPVLQEVVTTPTDGAANFAVAANGTMTYLSGRLTNAQLRRTLLWVDRTGQSTPVFEREAAYRAPRISPDGKRVAVDLTTTVAGIANRDIWVIDIERGTQTRLTSDSGIDGLPLWTPDGKRITFSSNRGAGQNALYWMAADGSGSPEALTKSESNQGATSWSPDGRILAFYDVGGQYDVFTMKPGEPAVPFSTTTFREQGPTFSPDGRWLAYSSNETGREEIYLTPYPGPGGRIAVSTAGGRSAKWSANGRELFYRNGRQMMVVTIEPGPTLSVGTPRLLFEGDYVQEDPGQGANNYDVSADGRRFLMMKDAATQPDPANAPPPQIIVVLHWDQELKRLVPTR